MPRKCPVCGSEVIVDRLNDQVKCPYCRAKWESIASFNDETRRKVPKKQYDKFSPRSFYKLKKTMTCGNKHIFKKGAVVYKYEPDGGLHCPYCEARLK
jgi:DNA-directed RNA polymerase subunit RPC12/RpoP